MPRTVEPHERSLYQPAFCELRADRGPALRFRGRVSRVSLATMVSPSDMRLVGHH